MLMHENVRNFYVSFYVMKHDVTEFMCNFFWKKDKYYGESSYMFFPFMKTEVEWKFV